MKIGFDAKRAFANTSGLGNYARTLIGTMAQFYPGNEYVAYTPSVKTGAPSWNGVRIATPQSAIGRTFPSWWRSALIRNDIALDRLHIFHGLSNELPRGLTSSTRQVVTIHDLIFLRYPKLYPAIDRRIYHLKFRHACESADAIVAVSNHTKKDIMEFFGIPGEKISVIYQSCDDVFSKPVATGAAESFRKRHHLPQDYFLYVGTIEERKNLLAILCAMLVVPESTLVVVGRKKNYFRTILRFLRKEAPGLTDRIFFPEGVGNDELPACYSGARALIYPSYYEGFGIPVIEALQCGTPVIASSASALPEAGGPSSLYFEPGDPKALATLMKKVMEDSALCETMSLQGKEYIKRFDALETSAALMSLYNKLA